MTSKIQPCLWFDGQAEEAAEFYVSVFNARPGSAGDSEILGVSRYGEAGPGKPGSAMTVSCRLEGQELTALNGGPHHSFTEAVSFLVNCETQEEVDALWTALSEGGEIFMPIQENFFAFRFAQLRDKFGMNWMILHERPVS